MSDYTSLSGTSPFSASINNLEMNAASALGKHHRASPAGSKRFSPGSFAARETIVGVGRRQL